MKKIERKSHFKVSIFIAVSLLLILSVYIIKKHNNQKPIKFAYITRSGLGDSYTDIYNEEFIREFSKITKEKTEVIKGSYNEIKNLEDIDIFIDFPVPSERDRKIELISKTKYVLYAEDENILERKSNEKIAISRSDNVLLRKTIMKYLYNNFIFVEDIEDGFKKLESGEVDAFLTVEDPIYMKNPLRKKYKRIYLKDIYEFDKRMSLVTDDSYVEEEAEKFIKKFTWDDRELLEERVRSKLIWSQVSITENEAEYLKSKNVIRVGGSFERMAPYAYFSKGEMKGNIAEYMALLKDGTGIKVEYIKTDNFRGLKQCLRENVIDIMAVYIKKEEDTDIVSTPPYFDNVVGIYGMQGKVDEDIEGILKDFDESRGPTGIKIDMENKSYKAVFNEGLRDLYRMLTNGEIDYFTHSYSILKDPNNLGGIRNLRLYGILNEKFQVSMGTTVENKVLTDILTRLFHYLDHDEIKYKWELASSAKIRKNTSYKKFAYILGGVVIFLLPYIFLLKREMEKIKKIDRELQETKKNLEEALNVKSAFLANMSHEMRTPLTAILGFNKLLLRKEEDTKKKELLNNVEVAGETLLNFINNVLDLSKLESGKIELKFKRINLFQMTDELERISLGLKRSDDVEFCFMITEDAPRYFMGDEVLLKEIILNLLGNAFKFTEKGSVQLFIARKDEDLIIEVKDTGIGMKNFGVDGEKIFKRYEQLDLNENRYKKGSGLGLAIVKEVVELMEGQIGVESVYKEGTTFRISLPIKKKLELHGSVRGVKMQGGVLAENEGA